jgi:hypothetical protein
MRKFLLLLIFIYATLQGICQSVTLDGLFSSGDDYRNSNGQITWTLGDIQIVTLKKEIIMTQGSLQTKLNIISAVQSSEYKDIEVKVFPNPVHEILNIKYVTLKKLDLQFSLYNIDGKIIFSDKLNDNQNSAQIPFTHLQSGYYILKVYSEDNKFNKTMKILYQE